MKTQEKTEERRKRDGRETKEPFGAQLTAAAVAAAAATAAATTRAGLLGARLVDAKGAAFELLAVQGAHGLLAVGVGHLDEAEALGLAGIAVRDDAGRFDGAVRLEHGAERVVVDGVGEVSDVELHGMRMLRSNCDLVGLTASTGRKAGSGDGGNET